MPAHKDRRVAEILQEICSLPILWLRRLVYHSRSLKQRLMNPHDAEISRLLGAWSDGNLDARDQLIPLVFDELRALARRQFRLERQGHTLEPTAVVNELYLRLQAQHHVQWRHRPEFFAVAARLMRRILVDHARRQKAQRREGGIRVAFDEALGLPLLDEPILLELDLALEELDKTDPRSCKVVELHIFAGLKFEEIAPILEVSRATVHRDWKYARLWLRRQLAGSADNDTAD